MLIDCSESDIYILRTSGLFDEQWYLNRYPDVARLGLDPIVHYLWLGTKMGRDPAADFSTRGYLEANPDVASSGVNPLLHYASNGRHEDRVVPPSRGHMIWSPPRTDYVSQQNFAPLGAKQARMIAFYLPQFHPIPENDEWWGKGFTEWSNVRPAKSQFVGHYQPHVPHDDLGYYNITDKIVQHKQIELANIYGIEAFCFYYYWFAGKRLLETPVEAWLEDPSLDHPFCVCWANENWSRRWDGSDTELLMSQEHSAADDLNCIADLGRYLRDPRYVRVDGRPLVLIYRPGILPSAKETAGRWRKWCRENGIGEIFLACTQSFDKIDPADFGFDAAVEFPPNSSSPPNVTDSVIPLSEEFSGNVYDWGVFVRRSEAYEDPGYRLFRSVCPGWDNTARRKTRGAIYVNNTPEMYEYWLNNAIAETVKRRSNPQERLVFVNAWNEWAEGAHLEPDKETGFAYLEATRRALAGWPAAQRPLRGPIAVVSHDAYQHGAQYIILNIARTLALLGYEVHSFLLGGGALTEEFHKVGYVHNLTDFDPQGPEAHTIVKALADLGAKSVICNTIVSSVILPVFKDAGYKIVSLIHEMPEVIRQLKLENNATEMARLSDRLVFPAQPVAKAFENFTSHKRESWTVRPQGLYKVSAVRRAPGGIAMARRMLRERLSIPQDAPIMLGVGYCDWRKGVDLFIEAGLTVLESYPDAYFVWLGRDAGEWTTEARQIAIKAGKADRFLFPGLIEETDQFYAGADIYALTSREDPFPSVVLEAMDGGLPVVAFAGATGMDILIGECDGALVPSFDTAAFGHAVIGLLDDPTHRLRCSQAGNAVIDGHFAYTQYVHDLLHFLGEDLPRVSVIVPNYNYARYIAARLQTIVDQTFPIYELIVLDDKSTDNSVEEIRNFLATCKIPATFLVNEENSGSVFRQWQRGIDIAGGDVIWIAEADDLAHPTFLAETVPAFSDPDVVISYSQSRQIDADGMVTAHDYLDYVSDLDRERWTQGYTASGREEIEKALFLKNTIPNASGAVFQKSALQDVLAKHGEEIISYRNAGDWVTYLRLLENGKVAFTPQSLNDHRRHSGSVTIGNANRRHLNEIIKIQSIAITRYSLGTAAVNKAREYAERIAKQFGITD